MSATTTLGTAPGPEGARPAEPGLGRKIASGAAAMVLARLVARCISVVSTLILVRLLLPEDFGVVALAAVAFVVVDTMTATGFGVVLVRRAAVDRDLYDTAWTMNLIRCVLLGGIVAATADLQASLLGDARIAPVLLVVALTVTLDGLVSIGMTRLQREMRFDLILRYQITSKLLSFALTILLAVILQSYWCLVLGNLIAKLILIPFSYYLAPHRPRFALVHWRELLNFSKWMFVINICSAADGQGPNLVLGRAIGVEAVGFYNIAYQIAAVPVTELAAPVRTPIYAGYAQVLHDRAALRQQFLDGFSLLCAVLVPLSVGIALVAPEIEQLALGPVWRGADVLIALCAMYALVDSMAHFTFNVFLVLDRQRSFAAVFVALVILRVPAIIAAALLAGTAGVLATMLATGLLNALIWHLQTGRMLGHGLSDVGARAWRSFAAAVAMTCAVLLVRQAWPQGSETSGDAVLHLSVVVAVGAAVHLSTQLGLWRLAGSPAGPERTLIDFAAASFRRLRRARA
ncbi:oligosaccharide flippase family protein [Roseomonas sp. SSH11]|uniref:Oligosaccharide flippase family protein n=1 Tax=Pararoseomonas baculiformis TaxID=2820812 RepID=A0ABS4AF27_9PROT|nr:oligosaccharide flippase family protein [Pararoseomonas baculiformis]MBP0445150.1 oligosaccharide flippase family protein [Pararoseomonas baculiformis]